MRSISLFKISFYICTLWKETIYTDIVPITAKKNESLFTKENRQGDCTTLSADHPPQRERCLPSPRHCRPQVLQLSSHPTHLGPTLNLYGDWFPYMTLKCATPPGCSSSTAVSPLAEITQGVGYECDVNGHQPTLTDKHSCRQCKKKTVMYIQLYQCKGNI